MVQTDANNSLVQTVDDNTEGFTKLQVPDTKRALSAYSMASHPPSCDFERMVYVNMIKKFPITVADIKYSRTIFGPDVGSLLRKIVQ